MTEERKIAIVREAVNPVGGLIALPGRCRFLFQRVLWGGKGRLVAWLDNCRLLPSNPIHLWDDDARFNNLMKQIAGRTLVDKTRCFICYQLAQQVSELPGDVAEVGVYRGGTARLLSKVFESKNKTVNLFDTFAGMPASDPMRDRLQERDFGDTSLESVNAYLQDCRNIRVYPGLFPATSTPIEDKTFCLVHIDADIYASVMDSCRFFYPRMQKGGVMIFDDYGFLTCPGAKMAVDEFFADKPEHPCYLPTGQCVVVRL